MQSETVTYDANSNITSLMRYGKHNNGNYSAIDILDYTYDGNRLYSIIDHGVNLVTEGAFDFKDDLIDSFYAPEYWYNSNGSLAYDANKGVSWINYDQWGNPIRVQFTDHSITEHVYTADGRRLKTIHRTSIPQSNPLGIGVTASLTPAQTQSIDSLDYVGNFIYEKGALKRYMFDDGYLKLYTNTFAPRFFIKDHLGNNRIVTDGSGNIQQNTNYYPYGGMTYISTNQGEQQFKYNGKEYDPMHGLNEYDYGARQYDPARGQFTTMDPLCEKYYHISPYAYCGGNPVNRVDVDGRLIVFINGWNYGNKGVLYWGKFDDDIKVHFNDKKVIYLDGSIGGIFNSIAGGVWGPTSIFFHNVNPITRFRAGFLKGSNDVEKIINTLEKDENGVITETMRLVTHSMGAAYAKGYATAIMEYVKKNPKETQGFKMVEYDFAPFQPESQRAVRGVTTYQYSNSDDWIGTDNHISGAKMMNANQKGGHFLKGFLKYIPELPIEEDNIKKRKEKLK